MTYFEYVERKSFIHDLHPLSKLLTLLIMFAFTSASFNFYTLLILLSASLVIWCLGRVPLRPIAMVLKLVLAVVVFFIVVQGFFYYKGRTPLFRIGDWGPSPWISPGHPGMGIFTLEGFIFGLVIGFKVIAIVFMLTLFVMTTQIGEFSAALSTLKVPYKYGLLFVAALRFTPVVFRTFSMIEEAQTLRGFEFKKNLLLRVRYIVPLIVPLFLVFYRKSQDLEVALYTKAFGAYPTRTYYMLKPMTWRDKVFLSLVLSVCVSSYVVGFFHTVV